MRVASGDVNIPTSPADAAQPRYSGARIWALVGVFTVLAAPVFWLQDGVYSGTPRQHATMEIIGSLIGFSAGLAFALRFCALGRRVLLFIGLAFMVNTAEDFVHGLLSIPGVAEAFRVPGDVTERFIPATDVTGRLLLAGMLIGAPFLASLLDSDERRRRETFLYSVLATLSAVLFTVVALSTPLPTLIFPDHIISRPVDLIAAWMFGAAMIVYLRMYARSGDMLYYCIALSLAIHAAGQVSMATSTSLYDAAFDLSHAYKVCGYFVPTMGFAICQIADTRRLVDTSTRLELAIASAQAGIWDWRIREGTFVSNEAFHTMIGEPPIDGKIPLDYFLHRVHPDDAASVQWAIQTAQAREEFNYDVHFRFRCANGSYKWIRSTGKITERAADGTPTRMIGQHIDVTVQVRDRIELAALEQRLRLFVEHAPAAVAMLDKEMNYLVASKGWYEEYGLGTASIVGRNHYDVFPTVPDRWRRLHQRALEGELLRCDRDSFVREDGRELWVRWQLLPWYESGRRIGGIIMFTEVINEQIERERRIEQAKSEVEAANSSLRQAMSELERQTKIANGLAARAEEASLAKSAFLANMSHEIRTPMTAILGYAELLGSDGDLELAPPRRIEYITTIMRNGSHLLAIINDILDLSKIEAGKMAIDQVETRPVDLIHDVMSLMDVKARSRGLYLEVVFKSAIPERIESDPVRLRQILVNLVGNAIKFTEIGGVSIRVDCDVAKQRLRIAVVDTGVGIPPEKIGCLFGAFEQADTGATRAYGGTGLGLHISKRLAEMLGGDIVVSSAVGEGSTFLLTIATGSIADVDLIAPPDAVRTTSSPAAEWPGKFEGDRRLLSGIRVLFAEDGPDNQRLVSHYLRKAGATVAIADNGKIAVEAMTVDGTCGGALAVPAPFDLIVMDMQMPEIDGYEATRLLRQKGCALPIIALTAHAMTGDRDQCIRAGCTAYAAKPIDRRVFLQICADSVAAVAATNA